MKSNASLTDVVDRASRESPVANKASASSKSSPSGLTAMPWLPVAIPVRVKVMS